MIILVARTGMEEEFEETLEQTKEQYETEIGSLRSRVADQETTVSCKIFFSYLFILLRLCNCFSFFTGSYDYSILTLADLTSPLTD